MMSTEHVLKARGNISIKQNLRHTCHLSLKTCKLKWQNCNIRFSNNLISSLLTLVNHTKKSTWLHSRGLGHSTLAEQEVQSRAKKLKEKKANSVSQFLAKVVVPGILTNPYWISYVPPLIHKHTHKHTPKFTIKRTIPIFEIILSDLLEMDIHALIYWNVICVKLYTEQQRRQSVWSVWGILYMGFYL